ncbi:MAG: hypothetical protein WA982_02115 [Rubrobacteraceae bacterium]
MANQNRESQWSSPERQEDLKYQEKMKQIFSPRSGGSNGGSRRNGAGGRMRGPLKEDTAVIDPVEPGGPQDTPAGGYARPDRGFRGEAVQDTGKPDLRRILLFALGALAVIVFFLIVAWLLFGRGGGEAGQEPQKTPASEATPSASEPIDTNLTFEVQDELPGEAYAIRMGEYEWEGTKGMNGDVKEAVLEGRTAAHFTTAVQLSDGEITTGVFGRAEPDRPLWHATYQRTTTDGQRATTGTYQAIEKRRVVLEGAYTDRIVEDRPGDEPDVIVREYVEGDPRKGEEEMKRFSAKFEAEEGAEIPWLPGNPIAEGGAEDDAEGDAGGGAEDGGQE